MTTIARGFSGGAGPLPCAWSIKGKEFQGRAGEGVPEKGRNSSPPFGAERKSTGLSPKKRQWPEEKNEVSS